MSTPENAISQVIDQALIEIYLVEPASMRILEANQSALTNLGYSPGELGGLTVMGITAQYTRDELAALCEPLNAGDTYVSFNNIQLRKDGSTYAAETRLQNVTYRGEIAYLMTVQDVTEKQHALDQLRSVITGGSIGFWDRDMNRGTYEVSDRSLEILGRSRDEFSGDISEWLALVHPDDIDAIVREAEASIAAGKAWTSEYRMLHRDGHWVWIQGNTDVVSRNPATGEPIRICGTHLDISNRKIGELERAEFYRFFEISTDIMIMADLSGNFLRVNPAVESLLGYTTDEMLSTPILDFIHPEDRDRTARDVDIILEKGYSFDVENRYLCKDGSYRWLSWRSTFDRETGHVFGLARDITEQKKVEEELLKKEARYRALAENSEDVIMQYDRQHRHIYTNPAVSNFMPFTPEEFFYKTHRDMGFPDELCELWEDSIERVFLTGQPNSTNFQADSKRGMLTLDWQVFPELNGRGEVESVFSVTRDVTPLKKAEEEQLKVQKLSSLGVLAGGIAHDFNNILTILFGNISLAKSLLPAGHESYAPLEKAENAFHRATHLTSQLLTFAKGGDPIRQNTRIAALIEEVTRFDLSGSNVKLVLDMPDNLWMADVDRGQVAQVFSNLTTNANQAMPEGGHLYIGAENVLVEDDQVKGLESGRYIHFRVRDEGQGIYSDDLEKIFDPYYSTKNTGSGLGLATVYSVIQRHGGTIRVNSTVGRGTVFDFYLPASPAGRVHDTEIIEIDDEPLSRKGRILVMDDEELICNLAKDVLEAVDFVVETVEEGDMAIDRYRHSMQEGYPFDCIIMDLTIPGGKGGAEAIKEILAMDGKATAIVSSGYAADPIMANYREYGFSGFLAKPFTMSTLRDVVLKTLENK